MYGSINFSECYLVIQKIIQFSLESAQQPNPNLDLKYRGLGLLLAFIANQPAYSPFLSDKIGWNVQCYSIPYAEVCEISIKYKIFLNQWPLHCDL